MKSKVNSLSLCQTQCGGHLPGHEEENKQAREAGGVCHN